MDGLARRDGGPIAHSVAGMPTNVLIAGGGPAALEAALRLHPVIQGVLMTERASRFTRTKITGRELAGYLEVLSLH
jgi:thioredoxin reductase